MVLVSGVHCVMPNGRPTAGKVWPLSSVPEPCFFALSVVAGAVPMSVLTYWRGGWENNIIHGNSRRMDMKYFIGNCFIGFLKNG